LGFALATMLAVAPARAAEDDVPLDSKIFRSILEGIGLRKDGEAINYQERAPLVIPPSRALPPPERSGEVIANNPAWPKDPDVQRRKDEAAQARNRIRGAGEQIEHDQRVLRPDELAPGPKPRNARKNGSPDSGGATTYGYGERLSPGQLGYKGGMFSNFFGGKDDDTGKFTGEPPRASLTEPPPGYQTPSPDQPYGLGERTKAPKPVDYATTHGEVEK
jgi:hypothetical protein